MIGLVDFNDAPMLARNYGGNAGRKICVEWRGVPWMLKFPEPTRGMRGNIASYTTSPVSEWLGSHVYESLGIPAHETVLGFREGKVVCACRDFTWPDLTLVEFHDLKNSLADELPGFEERPSDGRSPYLSDVLAAIGALGDVWPSEELRARFWDMFVVDTLIGNADRNSGNWGLLSDGRSYLGLAPVYDNGNAFFNKRRDSTLAQRLESDRLLEQDAVGGAQSCFLRSDGRHVAPLAYIAEAADAGCNAALARVMGALDLDAVCSLVDSLPEETLSFVVMPPEAKEFHKQILRLRAETYLRPALGRARAAGASQGLAGGGDRN